MRGVSIDPRRTGAVRGAGTGIRLAELIGALSLAIDLGMGVPLESMLHTTVLAVRLGEAAGLSAAQLRDVYYLGLLRFVGCNADAHTLAQALGDELAMWPQLGRVDFTRPVNVLGAMVRHVGEGESPLVRAGRVANAVVRLPSMRHGAAEHCEVAQMLTARMGFPEPFRAMFAQFVERWDGKGRPNHLKHEQIALPVRVLALANDAAIAYHDGGIDGAVAMLRERAGGYHDPALSERLCTDAVGLLRGLQDATGWEALLRIEPGERRTLDEDELDAALRALADFTDLKSPYLSGHSSAVGDLAAEAARRCGLAQEEVRDLRRAGYVHDIGRTGVSAALWGKRGPLGEGEWERVRMHPDLTEHILARPPALARLGALAALHHERLDGSGYHRGSASATLPPAARILAAADAYQALTEPRPHRPAHTPTAAAAALRREADAGRLDGDAMNAVLTAFSHRVDRARRSRPVGLGEREVHVLQLLARGHSNRAMATILTISGKTVGQHIQHIYDKTGVSTRAAATLFAMQHDLLSA